MFEFKFNKKGIALIIVIGLLFVVSSLTVVILSIILTNSRLTYHQTGRIQAYYAAMAGVNYGLEKLRIGSWVVGTKPAECSGSPAAYTCTTLFDDGDFNPPVLVNPTNGVTITIKSAGADCPAPLGGACVSATADYSYTNP